MQFLQRKLSKSASATALLVLGMGLGSAGTFLLQTYTSTSTGAKPAKQKERIQPKLTTDLLLEGEPSLGSPHAPLTIVEFSDFECSYCQKFHQIVLPKLKQQYIDTGLVRFIHKDLPLPFHSQALSAAAASRCAGEQNKYWTLYKALFDAQNCLGCKGVVAIAHEQGINTNKLQACMNRKVTTMLINANLSEAQLHGIRATPTFVIGPTLTDNTHRGEIIEGARPWAQFKTMLDQQLTALRGT
jgi:protein-disulfide isomerase